MTASAIFVTAGDDLQLSMLHLGTASQSKAPDDDEWTLADTLAGLATGPDPAGEVGPTLRRLRVAAGKSLRELARDADVSAGFLSQVERGRADPSLASLKRIAAVLGIPLKQLFDSDPLTPSFVMRRRQRHEITFPDSGVTYESLSPRGDRQIEVWLGSIPAHGASNATKVQHDGDEHILFLAGKARLEYGGDTVVLQPGDSAYLAAGVGHRLLALSTNRVRFLSTAYRPATTRLEGSSTGLDAVLPWFQTGASRRNAQV
jgi:transcriptional regulator with XRE-family HTH domain